MAGGISPAGHPAFAGLTTVVTVDWLWAIFPALGYVTVKAQELTFERFFGDIAQGDIALGARLELAT